MKPQLVPLTPVTIGTVRNLTHAYGILNTRGQLIINTTRSTSNASRQAAVDIANQGPLHSPVEWEDLARLGYTCKKLAISHKPIPKSA